MKSAEELAAIVSDSPSVAALFRQVTPWDRLVVVGGRVRNALLDVRDESADVDVMVDDATLALLWSREMPNASRNRHGNMRLASEIFKADIFSPGSFYDGFTSFDAAIAFFDLDVNAVGIAFGAKPNVVDPAGAVAALAARVVTPNKKRWEWTAAGVEQAVLRARLLKFLLRNPDFRCGDPTLPLQRLDELFDEYPSVVDHHVGLPSARAAHELRARLEQP